ncbi:hypothetical protein WJX84_008798 [Apatococcus fuscideae]|uniref:Uncharacterized protein n=1 Tax=Apatococcus fuscideae TaxID=2026836 RepID=A0AAW1T8Y1_9CHLO
MEFTQAFRAHAGQSPSAANQPDLGVNCWSEVLACLPVLKDKLACSLVCKSASLACNTRSAWTYTNVDDHVGPHRQHSACPPAETWTS